MTEKTIDTEDLYKMLKAFELNTHIDYLSKFSLENRARIDLDDQGELQGFRVFIQMDEAKKHGIHIDRDSAYSHLTLVMHASHLSENDLPSAVVPCQRESLVAEGVFDEDERVAQAQAKTDRLVPTVLIGCTAFMAGLVIIGRLFRR